ncbi:MAG: hypothetical protein DI537_42700 [Stutzerimonas stutzeri]|nr:MAG: hypothetical protein DI537_42700 [Stutzerimonas stutzeri]
MTGSKAEPKTLLKGRNRPAQTTRPEWTPRKVSIPNQYCLPEGGKHFGRLSLPAISMHIEACRAAGKDIRT